MFHYSFSKIKKKSFRKQIFPIKSNKVQGVLLSFWHILPFFGKKRVSSCAEIIELMAKRRKKKKIRWSGVAFLVVLLSGILIGLYYLFSFLGGVVTGWFTPSAMPDTTGVVVRREVVLDSLTLRHDSLLSARIEKLVCTMPRIDTARTAISVFDATTGHYVYEFHPRKPLTPASCMKLPTAIAALEILGDDYAYHTLVKVRGRMHGDTLEGELMLQAADDPLLTSFDSLVIQVRKAGIAAVRGKVSFDFARRDMLSAHPSTMPGDIPVKRIPMMLRGSSHIEACFLNALKKGGVHVEEPDSVDVPSLDGEPWREVASFHTSLHDVLTPMLIYSSNVKAEAVFYHIDRHEGRLAEPVMNWDTEHAVWSFWYDYVVGDGFFAKYREPLMRNIVMKDGSGLSPQNRLTSHLLVEMLRYAWDRPSIRNYFIDEALASPGHPTRHGSLTTRMKTPRFHDRIFVKTGTLATKGVSSLSGYVHAADDHWYIFSIINQKTAVAEGRLFQDEFCRLMVTLKFDNKP